MRLDLDAAAPMTPGFQPGSTREPAARFLGIPIRPTLNIVRKGIVQRTSAGGVNAARIVNTGSASFGWYDDPLIEGITNAKLSHDQHPHRLRPLLR